MRPTCPPSESKEISPLSRYTLSLMPCYNSQALQTIAAALSTIKQSSDHDSISLQVLLDETQLTSQEEERFTFPENTNAILSEFGRFLKIDTALSFTPANLKKVDTLILEGVSGQHLKIILEIILHNQYKNIKHLILNLKEPTDVSLTQLNTLPFRYLKFSRLETISINHPQQISETNREIALKIATLFYKNLTPHEITNTNSTLLLNNSTYEEEEEEMEVDEEEKIEEMEEAKEAECVKKPQSSLLLCFYIFKDFIEKTNTSSLTSSHAESLNISPPSEHDSIVDSIEFLFFYLSDLNKNKNDMTKKIKSLLDLTRTKYSQQVGSMSVPISLYERYFSQKNLKVPPEVKKFYHAFLKPILDKRINNKALAIYWIKLLAKHKDDVPRSNSFNDYQAAIKPYLVIQRSPELNLLREENLLDNDILSLLADRFSEFQKDFLPNITEIKNLVLESNNQLGQKQTLALIKTCVNKKNMRLGYMIPILSLAVRFPKKPTRAYSAFYTLIQSPRPISEQDWPSIKTQLTEFVTRAQQESFPEKPHHQVIQDFGKKSNEVKEVLPLDERENIYAQYLSINEIGLDLLPNSLDELKDKLRNNKDNPLVQIAITREVIKRFYGIFPYNIQLINLLALINSPNKRRLAQIKTGEGKSTIIAMLAAYHALQDKNVDIITTSNDLAKRDAEKYTLFFNELGVSVGHIALLERYSFNYENQVIYGPRASFQHDREYQNLGMKEFPRISHVGIIDEVDSMCIDTINSPAIISSPNPELSFEIYIAVWKYLTAQDRDTSGTSDLEGLSTYLKATFDINFTQKTLTRWLKGTQGMSRMAYEQDYILKPALPSRTNNFNLYDVVIVDHAHTGQLLNGQRWQDGIHQLIEARHGLNPQEESYTVAFLDNMQYFNLAYKEFYGLTGTLGRSRQELQDYYKCTTYDSPRYLSSRKQAEKHLVLNTWEEFIGTLTHEVDSKIKQNRPVLIICKNILQSVKVRKHLTLNKIKSQFYNGLQSTSSEMLLALTGNPGMVTVATNTAGRGADITPTPQAEANGGLHVIVTFPTINERVEEQAFGRTGRQGRQGTFNYILQRQDLEEEYYFTISGAHDPQDQIIQQWLKQREMQCERRASWRKASIRYRNILLTIQTLYWQLSNEDKEKSLPHWCLFFNDIEEKVTSQSHQIPFDQSLSNQHLNKTKILAVNELLPFWEKVTETPGISSEVKQSTPLTFAVNNNNSAAIKLIACSRPELITQGQRSPWTIASRAPDQRLFNFFKQVRERYIAQTTQPPEAKQKNAP